jgi:membrane associated rhomboid family serine protease
MLIDASELLEHVAEKTKNNEILEAPEISVTNVVRPFILSSKKLCPRDGTKLRYINYVYDSNVLLEECKQCRALWVESNHILPLAKYLKSRPELATFGEDMDRKMRHSDIEEHGLVQAPFVLSRFPIPLGDTTQALAFPWIVLSLMALQSFIFFIETFFSANKQAFLELVALIPENLWQLDNWHTLITHQLFHADLFHLIGNLFTLWIFGDNVESRFGPKLFFAFYIVSGIVAGLGASIFSVDPSIPMIGASGAISAVLGSYMVLYPKEKVRVLFLNSILGITVWKYLVLWFVFQLLPFIFEISSKEVSDISFAAHVIGFIFGFVATMWLKETKLMAREANFFKNSYLEQK